MTFDTKPKAPDTKWLEEVIDQLDADIDEATKLPKADQAVIITLDEAKQIHNTLLWTCGMLNGRKVYQKKQQVKRKIIDQLIKKHLSADEIAKINGQALKQAEATVVSQVEVDGDDN